MDEDSKKGPEVAPQRSTRFPNVDPSTIFRTIRITHQKIRHFHMIVNSSHLHKIKMDINISPKRTKSTYMNHNVDMLTLIPSISLDGAVNVIMRLTYSHYINLFNIWLARVGYL